MLHFPPLSRIFFTILE